MPVSNYEDLQGAHVFVTGGGSGIGADFVRAFMGQGARVSFVSLTAETAEALGDQLEAQFAVRPFYQQCDINQVDHLQGCIERAQEKYGNINVLINNAARDTRHTLDSMAPDAWDESLNTNLRPHFFTAQAVVESMRSQGGGGIINVGSNSSLLGLSGFPAYVTAKAAIVGLSKALARELGPDNIRVNTLLPGWVLTERQKRLWVTPEGLQECLDQQCLKKTVAEQDVSNLALFLASKASAMITGQAIVIDGGRV